ncbi:hypothetical protein PS1_026418 [Malus domestica]
MFFSNELTCHALTFPLLYPLVFCCRSGLLTIQQRLGVWTSVLFNIQDSSSLLEVLPLLQKFHLASNLRCIDCCCRCPI